MRFRKGHGAENCLLRQVLRETLFTFVSFSNIVMWNAGIIYYLLLLE